MTTSRGHIARCGYVRHDHTRLFVRRSAAESGGADPRRLDQRVRDRGLEPLLTSHAQVLEPHRIGSAYISIKKGVHGAGVRPTDRAVGGERPAGRAVLRDRRLRRRAGDDLRWRSAADPRPSDHGRSRGQRRTGGTGPGGRRGRRSGAVATAVTFDAGWRERHGSFRLLRPPTAEVRSSAPAYIALNIEYAEPTIGGATSAGYQPPHCFGLDSSHASTSIRSALWLIHGHPRYAGSPHS